MSTPRTLAEVIDAIARETDAPASLVDSVTALFAGKGIPLDADAAPYADAIRQAFVCDAQIRAHADRARRNLAALQERLVRLNETWERNALELGRVRDTLEAGLAVARHVRDSLVASPRVDDSIAPGFLVEGPTDPQ